MRNTRAGGEIWTAAESDVGLVRLRNEDGVWLGDSFLRTGHRSAALVETEESGVFIAVADGVGGSAAGDVASKLVLERMASRMRGAPRSKTSGTVESWINQAAAAVNATLIGRADSHDRMRGMATTLTGIFFWDPLVIWINAGDSRIYALRGGGLTQVSRDHTLREETGDLRIPGNIITNCFGTQNEFHIDTGRVSQDDDLLYLICSDGLSDYADHATLEAVMQRCAAPQSIEELEVTASRLVNSAKAGGGGDNITCIIVHRHRHRHRS